MSDYGEMLLLSGDDVDRLATMPLALVAAEEAARLVARGDIVTGRVQVNGPVAWMRVLAGMVTELDLLGYKEFHRVGRHVRYHVHLYRESLGGGNKCPRWGNWLRRGSKGGATCVGRCGKSDSSRRVQPHPE